MQRNFENIQITYTYCTLYIVSFLKLTERPSVASNIKVEILALTVGWLVVFSVPSTTRSFRDSAPFTIPCEGREARFLHCPHKESNPG